MTLWHRAPREVYRVYGEDEYLAEEALSAGQESPPSPADEYEADRSAAVGLPSHRSRSGRLAGLGLLAGVTMAAFGLVALHANHRSPTASRIVVAQTTRASIAAHASVDAPINHRAVAGMPNGRELRAPPPARARTRVPGHGSARSVGGNAMVARTSESALKAASVEPAQLRQPTTSEPRRSDAQVPPIDVEFEFER
jgi:hypothetical protein